MRPIRIILTLKKSRRNKHERYGVVKFEDAKFLYLWENIAENLWEVADDIEICGNIHENLDLLEGK